MRLALSRALREGSAEQAALQTCLVPQAEAECDVPARIGDYTDFYTSVYHATNIGKQFRTDNPLLPNYKCVPIGYHGRASSIGVSGQQFRRPVGQTMQPGATEPSFGPCNLQPGDLLGSGTLSGPTLDQAGALIELTTGGKNPIALPNGEQRTWLEDGDSVVLRGWCEKAGAARIGFGECVGTVLPARVPKV